MIERTKEIVEIFFSSFLTKDIFRVVGIFKKKIQFKNNLFIKHFWLDLK